MTTKEDGGPTTKTKVFPQPDEGCPECTTFSSVWTTSDSHGNIHTDSGVVIVTKDGQGILTTTTLRLPEVDCPQCTEFTTTRVTISEGTSVNLTEVIVVTKDAQGSIYTTTSAHDSGECSQCTEFITTWTGTGVTSEGVVVVTSLGDTLITATLAIVGNDATGDAIVQTEIAAIEETTGDDGLLTTLKRTKTILIEAPTVDFGG